MNWRLAHSLETLRTQVNAKWPNRSKVSDGTIGNAAHQATASDHNPNSAGVVTAMDITHDPSHGFDSYAFAKLLIDHKDPRIKYVISNSKIACSFPVHGEHAWVWRPYHGSNPHNHHVHVSVSSDRAHYDDPKPWNLG